MEAAKAGTAIRRGPDCPVLFAVPDIQEADIAAVTRILRSGWITTGDECERLEYDLSACLGGDVEVVATSSCTAALEIAAAYLGLEPGARVGVPTWTFASTALAVMKVGAVPVLLDSEPRTLNLDPDAVASALDDGLEALVAVHFGGVPVDPCIYELAAQAGVPVIEDAAHALGAIDSRGPIGAASPRGACFSFYATKNVTSAEGGALATTDAGLASFARSYRLHGLSLDAHRRYQPGRPVDYDLVGGGLKANLPDVLAALARSQLARLESIQARRREVIEQYQSLLSDSVDVLTLPPTVHGSADHLMIVYLDPSVDRSLLREGLSDDGVGTSVHFRPLHTFPWINERALIGRSGVGTADDMRLRALSLPLHTKLTDEDVAHVCDRLLFRAREMMA